MVELSGADKDLLAAKPILPTVIALLYGGYKFFDIGFSAEHYLYTYVPTVGAILSAIFVFMYVSIISSEPERSVKSMLKAFAGFIPYLFSLYLFCFLGLYSLWSLLSDFSVGTLIFGLFWIAVGYRMLYTFWIITEISVSE